MQWRSLSERNWSYGRIFSTTQHILKRKEQWLVCEGLDTVANITVNGKKVGSGNNMFVRHVGLDFTDIANTRVRNSFEYHKEIHWISRIKK